MDNRLYGSSRTVNQSGLLLQIEKAAEDVQGDLMCHLFCLWLIDYAYDYAMANTEKCNPAGMLIFKK